MITPKYTMKTQYIMNSNLKFYYLSSVVVIKELVAVTFTSMFWSLIAASNCLSTTISQQPDHTSLLHNSTNSTPVHPEPFCRCKDIHLVWWLLGCWKIVSLFAIRRGSRKPTLVYILLLCVFFFLLVCKIQNEILSSFYLYWLY